MISQKSLLAEKTQIQALKTIVDVYGEVASIRMMKIRNTVLKNRNFLSEIELIFQDCLAAYAKKLSDMVKEGKMKKGGKVTFLAHNGQTVSVFISANSGFYGKVVGETFKDFLEKTRQDKSEITIIGKLGRSLYREAEPNRPYSYFELDDFGVNQDQLSKAVEHLVQYEVIKIYYGKYYSVVTQKPDVVEISSGTPIQENMPEPKNHYIFEPNVDKILIFFETQIFASLFDQSLRESQLAKYASRILAMEEAGENVNQELKRLDGDLRKLRHQFQAKKQLNSLSSLLYVAR
jgi:ATP synthase F1 gamma subunit